MDQILPEEDLAALRELGRRRGHHTATVQHKTTSSVTLYCTTCTLELAQFALVADEPTVTRWGMTTFPVLLCVDPSRVH